VTLVETQNAGNAFIVIRGITQARNSEPSVAVVVDGVQQVNPAQFNQDLFDIEQIEVLKGPQGGLYGRNAIGGAIIIRTKEPTDEFEGKVTAGVDNGFGFFTRWRDQRADLGFGQVPPLGQFTDTDGYIDNPYLGEEADPYQDIALRGNLLFEPAAAGDRPARLDGPARDPGAVLQHRRDVNDTSLPVRVNNAGQNDRDIYNLAAKVSTRASTSPRPRSPRTTRSRRSSPATRSTSCRSPNRSSTARQLAVGFGLGLGFDLNQSQFLDVEAFSQELRFESPPDEKLFWMVGGYLIATDRFISTGNMVDTGAGRVPGLPHAEHQPGQPAVDVPRGFAGQLRLGRCSPTSATSSATSSASTARCATTTTSARTPR
jgi:iron complex outermembrane receptor protein